MPTRRIVSPANAPPLARPDPAPATRDQINDARFEALEERVALLEDVAHARIPTTMLPPPLPAPELEADPACPSTEPT